MALKFAVLACLVSVAWGSAIPLIDIEHNPNPQYAYYYDVTDLHTGDIKSQEEVRSGDVVKGSYSLLDADGLKRTVDYSSDPLNGFNAIVQRQPVLKAVAPAIPVAPAIVPAALPAKIAVAAPAPIALPSPLTLTAPAIASPFTLAAPAPISLAPKYAFSAPLLTPKITAPIISYPFLAKSPLSSTSFYSGPIVSQVGGLVSPLTLGVPAAYSSPILAKYAAPALHL